MSLTASRACSTCSAGGLILPVRKCFSCCSARGMRCSRRSSSRSRAASGSSRSPRSSRSWTPPSAVSLPPRPAGACRLSRLPPPPRPPLPSHRGAPPPRAAGDVEQVTVGGAEVPGPPREAASGAVETGEVVRSRHTRVDRRRLDALMDLIGELVTARGRLSELAAERRDPAVDDVAIQISRLSSDLQTEIIQARMTPVWQLFDRFPRLIRDLARELGKQVAFRVEGKEIELDRAILDELGDPLLHLLRNAVDHGIETAAERRRQGKGPEGEVVLAAVREHSSVAISVADDGRGIDRTRILERARRDGVVEARAEALSDDQLLRVLARPG